MKKKILTIMVGTMLAANIGSAAPITDLGDGQTNVGYNHYNLDHSGAHVKADSFYIEHGFSDKIIAGVERNGYSYPGSDSHTTDLSVQYKLDPNIRLIVGDRSYSNDTDKVFFGIGANVNLAPKLDGYASVITNNLETQWQVGTTYKMDTQASLHVGYTSSNFDHSTRDGLGFGINYKL